MYGLARIELRFLRDKEEDKGQDERALQVLVLGCVQTVPGQYKYARNGEETHVIGILNTRIVIL